MRGILLPVARRWPGIGEHWVLDNNQNTAGTVVRKIVVPEYHGEHAC